MILITKESDDWWYKIVEDNVSLPALSQMYERPLTWSENFFYKLNPDEITKYWPGLTLEDARQITRCKYEIKIND